MNHGAAARAAMPCSYRHAGAGTPRRAGLRRFLAGLFSIALLAGSASAQPAARPERLLVKPKPNRAAHTGKAVSGARVLRMFPRVGDLQVLELPRGFPAQLALEMLRQSGEADYVEPDRIIRLSGTQPNDFRHSTGELWNFHNTGYLAGTPGADIEAYDAWDLRREAPGIIVALVDSGVRLTHEDLQPNLWRNVREIPGNGLDDDGNGFVDDVYGLNAFADAGDPADDIGHGTHVAGIIGAVGNNLVGVSGVAWKVQLMATKFTGPDGSGTISDAIACIDYARQMGAQVINASWGADWFNSQALRDAIQSARDAGIIFVTVAGNNGGDIDAAPVYPAAYRLDNMIVATATDRNDQLAFYGNYGARTVDLGAPGHNIFSTWVGSDSDYQYYNGGSMAAAHVSGAVALVKAQFPGEPHAKTIERILKAVDPLPALLGRTITGGRLNLFKALGGGAAPLPTVTIAATDGAAAEAGADPALFTLTRSGSTAAPLTVSYSIGGNATNGADYAPLAGTATIPAGSAATTVSVVPLDDLLVEGAETITLTLTAAPAYTLGPGASASASIADNDFPPPTVTVAATDASAAEAGADAATFTFTRDGSTAAPLTIAFAGSGTATSGADYEALPGSVTIAAGATTTTVTVRPIDDAQVEAAETVILTLTSSAAYVLGGSSSATATIADNDVAPARPSVSVAATRPLVLERGPVRGEFTVSRSGGSNAQPLVVRFTLNGSASPGSDFTALGTSVIIPAGRDSATLAVAGIDDRRKEGLETVVLTLASDPAYQLGAAKSATVMIVDDERLFELLRRFLPGGS